jgi:hypothetical protein
MAWVKQVPWTHGAHGSAAPDRIARPQAPAAETYCLLNGPQETGLQQGGLEVSQTEIAFDDNLL